MLKIYFVAVIMSLYSLYLPLFGQFVIDPGDSITKVATVTNPDHPDFFEEVIVKGELSNNSGVADTIYWEIISIQVPSEWEVAYCGGVCIYDISVGQNFEYILEPTIQPNRPEEMKAQFTPKWQPGEGELTAFYYAKSDPAGTRDTLYYKLTATIDSSNLVTSVHNETKVPAIDFYPNPVNEELHIQGNPGIKEGTVHIYNIIGKQLAAFPASSTSDMVVPVGYLDDGIYLLKLFDRYQNQVYSNTFIKRN